jgi:hypothetical protein
MARIRVCAATAICVVVLACSSSSRESGSIAAGAYCLPASDFTAMILLALADSLGTSDAPGFVRLRDSIQHTRKLNHSQIVPMTDEAKCFRASRALDSLNIGAAGSPLYLVTMGTGFMAQRTILGDYVRLDSLFTVQWNVSLFTVQGP